MGMGRATDHEGYGMTLDEGSRAGAGGGEHTTAQDRAARPDHARAVDGVPDRAARDETGPDDRSDAGATERAVGPSDGRGTPLRAAEESAGLGQERTKPRVERFDLLVLLGYLLVAIFVNGRLWANVNERVQADNPQDQMFFEWVLSHAAYAVTHLQNPLFSTRMNVPDGVNLMANTSVTGIGVPLTPVTLLFGPQVSYAVMLTAALAGTAAGWYYVLSRHVVSSHWSAAVAAGFCGFSPGLISNANGHPNIASQFLVPFIAWRVLSLRQRGRALRNGVLLGLLVVYQAFINEEILFFTLLVMTVFLLLFAAQRPAEARAVVRPFSAGVAVTAAFAAIVLAVPLYWQFAGPQYYRGLSHWMDLNTDAASYFEFPSRSIAVVPDRARFSVHPAEENGFFGWPLLLLTFCIVVALWHRVLVRSLAGTATVFALLSLGPEITVAGRHTGIPGPWRWLERLPLFDSVVPVRLGLVVAPIVGVLLALGIERLQAVVARAGPQLRPPLKIMSFALVAAALLPLTPVPLRVDYRRPAPTFLTSGEWRRYVAADQTVVPVPLPTWPMPTGMWWQASTGLAFAVPRGYFLGARDGTAGDVADFGAPPRFTSSMLADVAETGYPPDVTEAVRRRMIDDVRYWRAALVVLSTHEPNAAALRSTLSEAYGAPVQRGDVWVWDVRHLI